MLFEKSSKLPVAKPANWTSCSNCGHKNDSPPSSEYQKRSSDTASKLNAANNGKGCVSS